MSEESEKQMEIVESQEFYRILTDGTWFYPQYTKGIAEAWNVPMWEPYLLDGKPARFQSLSEARGYRGFDQGKAIEDYTELQRRISVGAYSERSAEHFETGTYPEDGVEESIDNLTELAARHGLEFIWDIGTKTWSLLPMSEETKAARQAADETEQACRCAQEQAAHDIPYVDVGEARPFHYHYQSGRWYVEVDLKHHDPDQGAAIALYRVWKRADGSMAATKVDIREAESE